MATQRRDQFVSAKGIEWTKWVPYKGEKEPWQLDKKLKNEYK